MNSKMIIMLNVLKATITLLALSLVLPAEARSEGLQISPSVACNYLVEDGLSARGEYRGTGSLHRCSSRSRGLGGGGRVQNSIRYIASGDVDQVSQLRLELRVYPGSSVQRAHRQLVEYSSTLIMKSLGVELPGEIQSAILGATAGSWNINGNVVTLERIVAGQRGYELRFSIR